MSDYIRSAAGERLYKGDEVAYAGIAPERNRRPTINVGRIDAIDVVEDKVRVERRLQSGSDIYNTESKRVWVGAAKVVKLR